MGTLPDTGADSDAPGKGWFGWWSTGCIKWCRHGCGKRRRRLAELPWERRVQTLSPVARRLAAIPLPTDTSSSPVGPEPEALPEQRVDSLIVSTLGMVSTAMLCVGCVLKRYYRQLKSTFQPETRRDRPNMAAEPAV